MPKKRKNSAKPRGETGPLNGACDSQELRPSRSAKKRESLALQKLGEKLCGLSPIKRAELNLPEDLAEAIAMHDRITDREGARRQRQFIGKIMRNVNADEIAKNMRALLLQ